MICTGLSAFRVHNARMVIGDEDSAPGGENARRPSPAVAALIRRGVERILAAPPAWVRELDESVLRGAGMAAIADDPVLLDMALRTNAANLAQWAASNLDAPGERVGVVITEESAVFVRDLVRRGLDAGALDSFRTAQNVASRLWLQVCFDLTDDPRLLRELLEITSASIATFIDDTVAVLAEQIDTARAALAGDTHAERRAAVALILEGAPVSEARARLGYGLDGPQLAAVIAGGLHVSAGRLETVCEAIMTASGVPNRLTVLAGASQLWVWFPTQTLDVETALRVDDEVTVALGAPGWGREGFRRSHFQALMAHRTLIRGGGRRRVARYDDLRLLDAMTDDDARIDDFLGATLGDLRTADPDLAECLRIWFAERCNASAVAQRLYTHRNTVVRRLARAEELLPVPLEANAIAVAAALELHHWRAPNSAGAAT